MPDRRDRAVAQIHLERSGRHAAGAEAQRHVDLDKDVQLMVKDGDTVLAGAPVLKIVGSGASSWATFYDKAVTAQVMASVTTRPQGTEVDPVPVFRR